MEQFSLNQVTLIGEVFRVRPFSAGIEITLKVGYSKKVNDKWENLVDFHTVVIFGRIGDKLKDAEKGLRLSVVGRLENSSYEKDGQKIYQTKVMAEKVIVGSVRGPAKPSSETVNLTEESINLDDLPF